MAGKGRPGPECSIARALRELDEGGREVAGMAMDDPDTPDRIVAGGLTELLREKGVDMPVRAKTVLWHRQGNCRCDA